MTHLYVWLRMPLGEVLRAGEIRVAGPDLRRGGYLRGEFRYEEDYLKHPRAFALDPFHLPLSERVIAAERPRAGLHGIFEDSLPDDWGRSVLIRRFRLSRGEQSPPHLLAALGADCLGALAYSETSAQPAAPEPVTSPDLSALVAAAEQYDSNPHELTENALAMLFRAASSPGGARPKIVVDYGNVHWIAKLRSSRDEVEMVLVEAACLALARASGLEVPQFRVESLSKRKALLVKRFDVTAQGGRYHVASMQTLAGVDGYYNFDYAEMADIVRQISYRPEDDLPMLYRQAVFNAILGNTDDHLKNFAMLRDRAGWRLTPAYDLLPDIPSRGEHVLQFGNSGNRPTQQGIRDLARSFGLSAKKGSTLVSEVVSAFEGWKRIFRQYAVAEKDIGRLRADLDRRCAELAP
jgi:serine/threonine-protein kinase HipA